MSKATEYNEKSIIHLQPMEHIRKRPGMYIGKLGQGSSHDDGIYILLKEVLDNSVDEHTMGFGSRLKVTITSKDSGQTVSVTDEGRGIPLGSVHQCVAEINTGAKYDGTAFERSGGMNGVGIKAVNALSSLFEVSSHRAGRQVQYTYCRGYKTKGGKPSKAPAGSAPSGTTILFHPDAEIFGDYRFESGLVEQMLFQYAALNPRLTLTLEYDGIEQEFSAPKGVIELLQQEINEEELQLHYPLISLQDENIELVLGHSSHYGEIMLSFVNGQKTSDGGTHVTALREGIVRVIRDVLKKNFEAQDIRRGLVAALSIRIQEPIFESQTKTKLGSLLTNPRAEPEQRQTIKAFLGNFLSAKLEAEIRRSKALCENLQKIIARSEEERKEIAGIRQKSKELSKKVRITNTKLRDCRVHWDSSAKKDREMRHATTLFIVEGDSAAGPITKARDMHTQAVFPLRGKPFNCFGKSRKAIYDNEELMMLQAALGIEESLDGLRYNQVVLATDADVDGMHIRMLMVTFFLQYFPDLVHNGHLYILQTPLFRVRNRKETFYCYSEPEKQKAIKVLGGSPEITRFKGLGEISDHEFADFIGPAIRLEPVRLDRQKSYHESLRFFMGPNSEDRQVFICQNLRNLD
jgi:topoisomerase-4 subunit B